LHLDKFICRDHEDKAPKFVDEYANGCKEAYIVYSQVSEC